MKTSALVEDDSVYKNFIFNRGNESSEEEEQSDKMVNIMGMFSADPTSKEKIDEKKEDKIRPDEFLSIGAGTPLKKSVSQNNSKLKPKA